MQSPRCQPEKLENLQVLLGVLRAATFGTCSSVHRSIANFPEILHLLVAVAQSDGLCVQNISHADVGRERLVSQAVLGGRGLFLRAVVSVHSVAPILLLPDPPYPIKLRMMEEE